MDPRSGARAFRARLRGGAGTTVHVAIYERAATRLRVARLPQLTQLERWCEEARASDAIVGGFYLRSATARGSAPSGSPLGELWCDGRRLSSVPFAAPWGAIRACAQIDGDEIALARRDALTATPNGDLLQAGPLLVREGEPLSGDDEGFSAGAHQFDSDITVGRHPRAALGVDERRLIAVVCDGRSDDDAGLELGELANVMVELGARDALNLDGGGSASLVCGGRLVNVPREGHGLTIAGGRPVATALVFERR